MKEISSVCSRNRVKICVAGTEPREGWAAESWVREGRIKFIWDLESLGDSQQGGFHGCLVKNVSKVVESDMKLRMYYIGVE